MISRRFTILCDYRDGSYISQVDSADERDALRDWADLLVREKPIPRSSAFVAKAVVAELGDEPPVALTGLPGIWCATAMCGGNLILVNIVETVRAPDA